MNEHPDTSPPPSAPPRVVEVAGTPAERGRQYGEAARAEIERSIEYYGELFARTHGVGWAEVAERAARWEPAVEAFAPELAEELRGIATGAGRTPRELLALNARGEMVYGEDAAADAGDGCTAFAVLPEAAADGHVYVGQNWDWRSGARESVVVLRVVQPPKPALTMLVEAGQVGRHGASSAGIALMGNGLSGFHTREPRVPLPFIRRKALEAPDLATALELLLAAPHQIASNHLLCHRDGFAIDVEATPARRGWLYPDRGVLVHGNHYEAFSWAADGDAYKPYGADSLLRTWRLRQLLRTGGASLDASAIGAALRDHLGHPDGICTHPRPESDPLLRWQTLASSVLDLTAGEWRLALGNPCEQAHRALPWSLHD